jgi:hypothetical protein
MMEERSLVAAEAANHPPFRPLPPPPGVRQLTQERAERGGHEDAASAAADATCAHESAHGVVDLRLLSPPHRTPPKPPAPARQVDSRAGGGGVKLQRGAAAAADEGEGASRGRRPAALHVDVEEEEAREEEVGGGAMDMRTLQSEMFELKSQVSVALVLVLVCVCVCARARVCLWGGGHINTHTIMHTLTHEGCMID